MIKRPPFRAALVQMRSGVDERRNIEAAATLIREAARGGARLVITPEMTNLLDRDPERFFAHARSEADGAAASNFAALAGELGVWLLIGSIAALTGARRAANRSLLISPQGAIVARYDKIHRFDVSLPGGETWRESAIYDAGNTATLVATPLASIGLTICYDVRFPHLYRALAQAGAELFAVPAAFTRQTGEAHWKTLLTARAIENGAYVLAAAQGGRHEDGRETWGRSLAVGPWGEVLAEATGDEPGLVFAEIDPQKVHDVRARIPNLALEPAFKLHTITL